VLVTPPPHRVNGPHGGTDGGLVPYATVIKAVAKERNVPCIDLFPSAGGLFNGLGEEERLALSIAPRIAAISRCVRIAAGKTDRRGAQSGTIDQGPAAQTCRLAGDRTRRNSGRE